jgi:uncharacterized membrane protein
VALAKSTKNVVGQNTAKNSTKFMISIPVAILIFILFILFLPVLCVLAFLKLATFGFENLGFSANATILILALILLGSVVNIPLTKKELTYVSKSYFFGLFKKREPKVSMVAINLGGAIIPILISLYFLTKVPLQPVLIAIFLMIIVSKILAKPVAGKGIVINAFIPPLFAVLFAIILAPSFAAPCAFISGVLGILIGGDILNLRKARKINSGLISIGGAGVFDGIFLTGIISALLV